MIFDQSQADIAYSRCKEQVLDQPEPPDKSNYCLRNFDGWGCWSDTPAGSIAYNPCPSFVIGFDSTLLAHKECMEDGTWFRHPDTNLTWSNYTTCINLPGLARHQLINNVYIAGYSISLIALLVSLFIFFYFNSLRCARITIHKNLFFSFIVNNVMWIIWYTVIMDPLVLFENGVACQVVHVFLQYFLVCNYLWMFNEGLYLHTLLVIAFVNEDNIMRWLYAIGWGIPVVITLIYAISRGLHPEEANHCWMEENRFTKILIVPVCVSMLVNLIFLVNIVRVLVTKLRAVNTSDTNQTRKAVRATVILIPLLGLYYIMMPLRPNEKTMWGDIYAIITAVVTSFQGLCVAMLFCLCNGEVLGIFKKKWMQHRDTWGRKQSMAGTSISFPIERKSENGNYEKMRMMPVGAENHNGTADCG